MIVALCIAGCGNSKAGLVEGKVNVVTSFIPYMILRSKLAANM